MKTSPAAFPDHPPGNKTFCLAEVAFFTRIQVLTKPSKENCPSMTGLLWKNRNLNFNVKFSQLLQGR